MRVVRYFLFLTISSSFVIAQEGEKNPSLTNTDRIRIDNKDRKKMSDGIQGVDLNLPTSLQLKGDLIDLSDIIKELNRLKSVDVDNRLNLVNVTNLLQDKYLKPLCEKSKNEELCWNQVSVDLSDTISAISDSLRGRELSYSNNELHLTRDYKIQADTKGNPVMELIRAWTESMNQDLSCPTNCSHENWFKMISFVDTNRYQHLKDKIENQADKTCKRKILESIVNRLKDMWFPSDCFEKKKNELTPRCVDSLKSLQTLQKRLSDLVSSVYGEQDLYKTSAGAFCVDCLLQEGKSYLETIKQRRNFIKSVQEREECLDLKPGEKKQIQGQTPYTLKRSAEGDYEIDFPLEFFATEDYDGKFSTKVVPTIYRYRVQKCLEQANKRMLGPGGEKLKISISRPPVKKLKKRVKCFQPPLKDSISIGIASTNHRSTSKKYESDIDCPSIIHEILHLTGLCDEYNETLSGFFVDPATGKEVYCSYTDTKPICKPKYDCRVLTRNSIMSNHWERWEYATKNNKSLLSPGQFKKILYGSCPSKNAGFDKCYSELAYSSSDKETEYFKDDCEATRDKCFKENSLNLDKEEQIEFLELEIVGLKESLENTSDNIASPETHYYRVGEKQVSLSEIIAQPKNYPEWMNPYNRRDSLQRKLKEAEERLQLVRSWPDP